MLRRFSTAEFIKRHVRLQYNGEFSVSKDSEGGDIVQISERTEKLG
jgi:hypothetical protein